MALTLVVANTVSLALYNPLIPAGHPLLSVLDTLDWVFLSLFTLELLVRLLAQGLLLHRKAFLRSGWNLFDLTIVVIR